MGCPAFLNYKKRKMFHSQRFSRVQTQAMLAFSIVCIVLFIIFGQSAIDNACVQLASKSTKQHIVCVEDDDVQQLTGLENIQFLSGVSKPSNIDDCTRAIPKPARVPTLTSNERENAASCVKTSQYDFKKGHTAFWDGETQYVRILHHTYLNSKSIVLDIGGNVGDDAENLLKRYGPSRYVLLEPMKYLFRKLQKRFKNDTRVTMYNVGLGHKNKKFMLNMEGTEGDATSPFMKSNTEGTCSLKVVNATDFFTKIGVGCFEVDLLTVNCEGCEFDVLETLLSTNLVQYFKHVQFAAHTRLDYISKPIERYCQIQELLRRTHTLSYEYKFNWETWTRKDLSKV